jgi:hypothetical protein
MKLLQDLVPGCNKVTSPLFGASNFSKTTVVHTLQICFEQITGKAVMLDEIINYVQSLQRQVEVVLVHL